MPSHPETGQHRLATRCGTESACMRACVRACMRTQLLSCVFATPWTVAHQAPLSMGFSRQEYWSGLLCPPPGDLPYSGIKPTSPASPALQADSLPLSLQGSPGTESAAPLTPVCRQPWPTRGQLPSTSLRWWGEESGWEGPPNFERRRTWLTKIEDSFWV